MLLNKTYWKLHVYCILGRGGLYYSASGNLITKFNPSPITDIYNVNKSPKQQKLFYIKVIYTRMLLPSIYILTKYCLNDIQLSRNIMKGVPSNDSDQQIGENSCLMYALRLVKFCIHVTETEHP